MFCFSMYVSIRIHFENREVHAAQSSISNKHARAKTRYWMFMKKFYLPWYDRSNLIET